MVTPARTPDVLDGVEHFGDEAWALHVGSRGKTLAVFDARMRTVIHWKGFDASSEEDPKKRRQIADLASRGPALVHEVIQLRARTRALEGLLQDVADELRLHGCVRKEPLASLYDRMREELRKGADRG